MNGDEHKKSPKTITEVGIHVGYLREDIGELKDLIKNQSIAMATKAELKTHDERITKLEATLDTIKNRIIKVSITIFVGMVLALYGLDKWFK